MSVNDQVTQSYDESFELAEAEGGTIYEAMSPIIAASHERRMQLLDQLPIGDVSDKICVDYGVGSWGFACIYPRLQHCAYAIGLDISEAAVRISEKLSEAGTFPYGKNYRYLTSRGSDIDLDTQSADIFFTGECIEHVEHAEAFLDEIHRILRPGGQLILTTPNADACLYKAQNERYCVGPEHLGLMNYDELCTYLEPRFEIIVAQGYNHSLHWSIDTTIVDPHFAQTWAAHYETRPDLASGLIIMARRRDDYQPVSYVHRYYHHSDPHIQYTGSWNTASLHKAITGTITGGDPNARLTLSFEGSGLILHFWVHAWSGIAQIKIDDSFHEVNLYAPLGGFIRQTFTLAPGKHQLVVKNPLQHDSRSHGNEIIFYQAISFDKVDKPI